ncbi:hypothetical protein MRY87_03735 [bacterium]|nr:hypothetical protein [bacterium]
MIPFCRKRASLLLIPLMLFWVPVFLGWSPLHTLPGEDSSLVPFEILPSEDGESPLRRASAVGTEHLPKKMKKKLARRARLAAERGMEQDLGDDHETIDLSERHYIAFPLAVALIIYLISGKFQMVGLGLAAIIPIMFFGVRYVFSFSLDIEHPGVVVTRLRKDARESKTLRLREQLRRFSTEQTRGNLERHFLPVRSHRMALKRFPNAPAVIWGDRERIRVSFQAPPFPTTEYRKGDRGGLGVLVVNAIPGLDLSLEPVQQTGLFLARILEALENSGGPEELEENEVLYQTMANHESHWGERTHLAYPMWRLGNLYLEEWYLSGVSSAFTCAIDAYGDAASAVHPHAHPLLRAAIFNNKAAILLLSQKPSAKKKRKAIRAHLRMAEVMVQRKGEWRAGQHVKHAIRRNLKVLKRLSSKSGKGPQLQKQKGRSHE